MRRQPPALAARWIPSRVAGEAQLLAGHWIRSFQSAAEAVSETSSRLLIPLPVEKGRAPGLKAPIHRKRGTPPMMNGPPMGDRMPKLGRRRQR